MAAVIGALRAELSASIAQFQTDMGKAAKIVEGFGARFNKMSAQLDRVGKQMFRNVTLPVIGIGAAIVKTAGDFEAGMNRVQAATGASADELAKLRALALDIGPKMGSGPTAMAEAFEMLAKNGLTATQILNGAAKAALVLAKSTGAELGPAADVVTDLMAQFGKQAEELGGVIDDVNGVLIASKLDFDGYRLAIGQAGGVAGAVGVSFEDFNAVLAATAPLFASGSDAGTSFKTFLQRLSPQSEEARKVIEYLGLEFFDAQGKMKSMSAIAEELRTKLAGLTDEARQNALVRIFGTDAIRTAVGLMKEGAAGIDQMKASIDGVSADQQLEAKLKGINGQMNQLIAQLQGLAIAIADSGFLEFVTSAVKGLADWIQELRQTNPELLSFGVQVAGIAAVAGPVVIALGVLASSFGAIATVIRVAVLPALWLFIRHPVILGGIVLGVAIAALIENFQDLCDWISEAVDWLTELTAVALNPALGVALEQKRAQVRAFTEGIVKDAQAAVDQAVKVAAAKPIESLPMIAPKLAFSPIDTGNAGGGKPKTTIEDLNGALGGGGAAAKVKDFAKAIARSGREVRDLGREVDSLTGAPLSGLKERLREVDDKFEDTRLQIQDQIDKIKELGTSTPETVAQLANLQALLAQLADGHAKAAEAARAQYEAEKALADLKAQAQGLAISQQIGELQNARGDNGVMSEAAARLQAANDELDRQRMNAAIQLKELETQRFEAARTNDTDAMARLDGVIALQREYYGLLEATTAQQLEDQKRIQGAWTTFESDLSAELADTVMRWKFDLDGLRNIFADLAKQLFIKPFTDSLASGLGGILKGFAGGFAAGGRIWPGQWGVVGENGPELARAHSGGIDIQPLDGKMGGTTIYQNITTPNPDAFRASRRQIARQTKEALA